ncbi:hypothetical protein K0M31_009837 [Melipona bicolor]|uniref:Uncharacterized protein n=1 Tax=Melipona bicolor TaxID=60889 RepID=A0AA40FMS5_9HYME|nr:hypothetical protein K0M31_009837 [Melipona bicolor]
MYTPRSLVAALIGASSRPKETTQQTRLAFEEELEERATMWMERGVEVFAMTRIKTGRSSSTTKPETNWFRRLPRDSVTSSN